MSKGILNNPAGPRNNFGYQINVLKLLGEISTSLTIPGGLATEATALNILSAIQNGKEFEQNIVIDLGDPSCPNCPTYLMVRIWNTVTHTFDPPIYYDASGSVIVPIGPVQIVNPQFVLDNILTQVTAINTNLDVALSTRASELTLLITNSLLTTLNSTVSTESTLSAFSSKFDAVVRNPTMIRSSSLGTISAGSRSVSIYNAGNNNAIVLGTILLPGERVSFSADGEDDTLASITYDGTGTDLLIIYIS